MTIVSAVGVNAAPAARVTVAIAFLDEMRFLADAVDEVRRQTLEAWRLILVDDGSTDGSSEIADEFARADPERIAVVRHEGRVNRGLAASRNLAIHHASTEFLCFLDADDLWSPDKLVTQLDAFATYPDAVMVCGPSWHRPLGGPPPGELVAVCAGAPRLLRRGAFARMRMRGTVTTPPPSDVMYRLATLREVGGVPEGPGVIEDQRTYVAVALRGPVAVLDRPLTTYHVRTDSLYGSTRDDGMQQVRTHREFERWVVRHCARRGLHGAATIAALMERRLRRGMRRRLAPGHRGY